MAGYKTKKPTKLVGSSFRVELANSDCTATVTVHNRRASLAKVNLHRKGSFPLRSARRTRFGQIFGVSSSPHNLKLCISGQPMSLPDGTNGTVALQGLEFGVLEQFRTKSARLRFLGEVLRECSLPDLLQRPEIPISTATDTAP
jgi:hypothetical protein